MRTLMTLWVWTSPRLAWEPLRSVRLGSDSLSIQRWLEWWRRLLFVSCFLFLHYFYIWSLLILFAVLGASYNTISGWADVLEAVYKDIGGCSSYIPYCITFCLMFLTLKFAARPPLPPSEEHGLLQVDADELGAAMYGMFLFLISRFVTLLFLWLTLV